MNDQTPVQLDRALVAIRDRTPPRILVSRPGPSSDPATHRALRADHAAARDAVDAELLPDFVASLGLRLLSTLAATKTEYLLRPELGRRLNDDARRLLASAYPKTCDLQFIVG